MTTILVIEDEPSIRSAITEWLEQEGFATLAAENGRIGVALAVAERPDLIVCDISMPELDGYGVLDTLRRFPETATVPFIFLSAKSDRADVRAGMNRGADDYLAKPFGIEELVETIRARLRLHAEKTPASTPPPVVSSATAPTLPGIAGSVLSGGLVAGRFEIERKAGAGGMAVVFRARDRSENGRLVALKVLHDPGETLRVRFDREARVLADLKHPHIVGYISHGETPDGAPYLAMDWLEGDTLGDRLARGTLTVTETVRLGRHIAEALGAAHARGVLHRDVKPSNLFLVGGDVEDVRLLDFGIARVELEATRTTRTGTALGTPQYMAPEQATGSPDIDARADVYSLACVMFECLTGRPPFVGASVMVVLSHLLFDDAPRLRDLRPEVPASLDALVARMLARELRDRPTNGTAVAAELSALEAELGTTG